MQSIKNIVKSLILIFQKKINFLIPIYGTKDSQSPVTFKMWFIQKILGFNRKAYWPVHHTSEVGGPENILIGVDAAAGISPGCYIQGGGKVYIGDYTQVGPNVGIISANHDPHDNSKAVKGIVRIGEYCWIGMNSVITPNVELGDFTIVGAGSVVTKSFSDGYCIIAGNPAKKIKDLDPSKCIRKKNDTEYIGYYTKEQFKKYRKRKLKV